MRYFLDGTWAAIRSTLSFLCPTRNATHLPCHLVCTACLTCGVMPSGERVGPSPGRAPRAGAQRRNRRVCTHAGKRPARGRGRKPSAWRPSRYPRPQRGALRAISTSVVCVKMLRAWPRTRRSIAAAHWPRPWPPRRQHRLPGPRRSRHALRSSRSRPALRSRRNGSRPAVRRMRPRIARRRHSCAADGEDATRRSLARRPGPRCEGTSGAGWRAGHCRSSCG